MNEWRHVLLCVEAVECDMMQCKFMTMTITVHGPVNQMLIASPIGPQVAQ